MELSAFWDVTSLVWYKSTDVSEEYGGNMFLLGWIHTCNVTAYRNTVS